MEVEPHGLVGVPGEALVEVVNGPPLNDQVLPRQLPLSGRAEIGETRHLTGWSDNTPAPKTPSHVDACETSAIAKYKHRLSLNQQSASSFIPLYGMK